MPKTIGDVIREYREKHSISMHVFSERSGLSKAYISMLENNRNPRTGKPIEPSLETYISVANATGNTVEDLLVEAGSEAMIRIGKKASRDPIDLDAIINRHPDLHPFRKIRSVPILGTIACGTPIWAEENFEGYVGIDPMHMDGEFALICKGDSMIDANIQSGDIVLLKKVPDVEDGKIAAVLIDNEATLKKVYKRDDSLVLQPCNRNYGPIVYSAREAEDSGIQIIGECVGVYHAVKE